MNEDLLKEGATKLGVDLTASQLHKFSIYLKTLLLWNKKVNLTAITDEKDVVVKHFLDSLAALKAFPIFSGSVVDIGAGAGFPGLPIAIACPGISLTLIDSVRKKTEFLHHLASLLSLHSVDVVWGRAEDLAKEMRERFDASFSRAVAPLNVLAEYSLPFLKVHGIMVALKGKEIEKELESCEHALATLGGEIKDVVKVRLPGTDIARNIVLVEKTSVTPEKFPRRAGMAEKKPL